MDVLYVGYTGNVQIESYIKSYQTAAQQLRNHLGPESIDMLCAYRYNLETLNKLQKF